LEDHNSAAEAMIKIRDADGRKPLRVRLTKGFLFKLVIKTDKKKEKVKSGKDDDAKMLRELLANAKKLNEAIYKDLYDDSKAKDRPFFTGNKDLRKQFKDHFVFETKKTIYRKLNAFIKKWSLDAGIADSMEHPISFDLATKFPTVESSITQLKNTFIGPCHHHYHLYHRHNSSLSLYRILQTRKLSFRLPM